jgi:formylglycine-generating enzyme required for sulfatase activity
MTKSILAAMVICLGAATTIAWAVPPATQPAKNLTLKLGENVTLKLVLISSGKFLLGSPVQENHHQDNEGLLPAKWANGSPQIEVTISKPFYLGVTLVTVDQYAQFVKDTGQKHGEPKFKQTGNDPVVDVSWDDAQSFCGWLSKRTGKTVMLPTEAQWEYACRAGSTTAYYFGNDERELGKYEWYIENAGEQTHPVGQKQPNAWGLYDMSGNVLEWCNDIYGGYDPADRTDPSGLNYARGFRVERGGSWYSFPNGCRSACRDSNLPETRVDYGGFRVAVTTGID